MANPDPDAPVASKPLCDCYGCGMPATASIRKLNHCYNHKTWAETPDAEMVRAKKAAGG